MRWDFHIKSDTPIYATVVFNGRRIRSDVEEDNIFNSSTLSYDEKLRNGHIFIIPEDRIYT